MIDSLARDVRDFEPREALDGGLDGLEAVRKLAPEAYEALAEGGLLAMEIGDDQSSRVEAILEGGGWARMAVVRDLAGLNRVVTAQKGPQ